MLTYLFADDTSFQITSPSLESLFAVSNSELLKVSEWFAANKLTINIDKTKYMVFNHNNRTIALDHLDILIENQPLERIGSDMPNKYFKFLGIYLDDKITWDFQLKNIQGKISAGNFALARVKNLIPTNIKMLIYNSLIKSHLEYGIVLWGGVSRNKTNKLLNIQKKALRNVHSKSAVSHCDPLFRCQQALKVQDLYNLNSSILMYKYHHNTLPESFQGMFIPFNNPNRTQSYKIPKSKTEHLAKYPSPSLPRVWNSLSLDIKSSTSVNVMKNKLITSLIGKYSSHVRCNRPACPDCR